MLLFPFRFIVSTDLSHILLNNLTLNDVIELFNSQKSLTDDDLEVILFSPSEYLKKQLLFGYALQLRLNVWLKICDVVHSIKSLKHISGQLMNGKLLNFAYIVCRYYILMVHNTYTYVCIICVCSEMVLIGCGFILNSTSFAA